MRGTQKMARMSWDEMVKQYPNMWVAVKDAEMNGIDVLSGEVVTVQPDDKICKFRMKHRGAGFVFRRTSESGFNGHIGSDFTIRVE